MFTHSLTYLLKSAGKSGGLPPIRWGRCLRKALGGCRSLYQLYQLVYQSPCHTTVLAGRHTTVDGSRSSCRTRRQVHHPLRPSSYIINTTNANIPQSTSVRIRHGSRYSKWSSATATGGSKGGGATKTNMHPASLTINTCNTKSTHTHTN